MSNKSLTTIVVALVIVVFGLAVTVLAMDSQLQGLHDQLETHLACCDTEWLKACDNEY
jgi:hypothetical protein